MVDTLAALPLCWCLISGFRHKGLEDIYHSGSTRRIGAECVRKCLRVLKMLDAAELPDDMNIVGLRLHVLKGKPLRWSVRVTANYRITFGWHGDSATEVDFEDYH